MNVNLNPPLVAKETMSEDDWKKYFDARKKFDVEFSEEKISNTMEKAIELREQGKEKEADELVSTLPAEPNIMLSVKTQFGFKAIQEFNLSEAKKVYPNEF